MANHDLAFSNGGQVRWTCKALLSGRTLNHETAIREVRAHRLAAIIHRLIHKYDWPIDTQYTGPENTAEYKLRPGCDRNKLRFPPSALKTAGRG
ncbi:hypothetical protein [Mangrovicoccus algicola]|uniref:Transposase n=1 Tax=Mangrovicoccus algicola TaxID=2771008 RepID=A0A8J6YX58_9RHOB|nr:hypothetical protein [Mangrovicoccus algicola]MBE3637431.1 hypothetical protein [Mangrovicoccus algicola]